MKRRTTHAARATKLANAERPTIEDVARHAGVSLGTVSNVLNQRGNVRTERASRVHDAIAALRYVPNGVAQSLRRQSSRVVGLCAPLTSSAYFAALLDAFEDIASAQGYEVMQVLSRQDPVLEERRVRALIARKVDGLIVIPSASPQADVRPDRRVGRARRHRRPPVRRQPLRLRDARRLRRHEDCDAARCSNAATGVCCTSCAIRTSSRRAGGSRRFARPSRRIARRGGGGLRPRRRTTPHSRGRSARSSERADRPTAADRQQQRAHAGAAEGATAAAALPFRATCR